MSDSLTRALALAERVLSGEQRFPAPSPPPRSSAALSQQAAQPASQPPPQRWASHPALPTSMREPVRVAAASSSSAPLQSSSSSSFSSSSSSSSSDAMAEALRLASAVLGIEMGAEDRTDGYPTDVAAADNARVAPAAARYAATASKAAAAAEASVQARQRELMQRMGILDGENDLAAVLTAYDDARASVAAAERQPQQPPPPQQQRVAPVVDQQQAEQRAALRQQQRAATLMEPEEDAYSSAPAFEPAPPAEPMDRNPPQSSRVHVNRSGSVFIDGGAEYSAPAPELKVAMQPVPARAAAAAAAATQQQPQEQAAATTVSVAHAMIVDGLRSDNELLRSMLGQLQKETAQRVTGLQEELRTVTAEKERYRSALIRAGIPTGVQQPSAEHGAAQSAPRHSYAPSVAGDRLDAAVARLLAALGEHCLVKMALTRRPGQLVATHPAVYDADAPLSISFAHDGVTLLAERDAARGGGTVALRDYLAALYAPFTLPSGAAPAAAFATSAGSSSSSSSSSGRSGGSPGAVAAAMFARARTPVDFGLTPDFASVKQTVIKPPSQSFPQQLPPQLPPQSQAQQEPQSRVRINRHGSISIGALNGGAGGGAGAGVSSSPPSPQPAFGSLLAHLSAHKPASGLGGGNGSGRPLPRSSLFQALQAEEAMLLEEEETPPQGGVRRRGTYFGSTTTPASPAQQVREFKSSERRRVQQQQRMPMPEGSYRASPIASPPPSMPFGESPSAGAGGARTVVQMRRSMPRQGGAAAEQSPPPPMPSSQTQPPPPAGRPPTGGGRRGRQRGTPGRKAGQGYAAAPPSSSSLPPPPPGRPPAYSASGSRSSKKVAHGSSFTVALPFRAVAAVEAEPPAAPRSSKGGGKGSASVGYKGKMRAARLTPSQKQAEKLRKRALGRKPRGRQGRGRYRN